MGLKTKVTIVAAAALALLAFVNPWRGEPAAPGPGGPANPVIPLVAQQDAGPATDEPGSRMVLEEVAVLRPTVAGSTTGALAVRVLYGADEAALAEVGVRVLDNGTVDRRYGSVLAHTDAEGRATFPSLRPGPCSVWTDRARRRAPIHRATVVSGETTELVIRLEPGIDIEGIVVDADGLGVAGAGGQRRHGGQRIALPGRSRRPVRSESESRASIGGVERRLRRCGRLARLQCRGDLRLGV